MTPRTLIAAALLALSGLGLVSRVEGSIIAPDLGLSFVEGRTSIEVANELTDERRSSELPFDFSDFEVKQQFLALIDTGTTSSTTSPPTSSTSSPSIPAMLSQACLDADEVSSPLEMIALLSPKHPPPTNLLRPPILQVDACWCFSVLANL